MDRCSPTLSPFVGPWVYALFLLVTGFASSLAWGDDSVGSSVTAVDATPAATAPPEGLAEELVDSQIGKVIRRFSYGAIILILLLCGLGLPLPEEVPILVSGVLAGMGHMHAWPALIALMIGVMLGDSAMFLLGRRWGSRLFEHRFARRMLTVERQARIAAAFAKYGALVIFVARFLPGLRAPLFLTAGSMRVKFVTFFTMDGLAALLSVPISFWVAYVFTDRLQEMLDLSHKVLYWVLAGLIVLLLVGHVVYDRWRRRSTAVESADADLASSAAASPSSEKSV
ncbi:MAG: DedA family protein [Planctomycetaceae bacterium]